MAEITVIEGDFTQCSGRYALVVGRFNGFVVESLVEGAIDTLRRHGIATMGGAALWLTPVLLTG